MCVILEPRHWRPLQLVAKRIQHFDPTLMYFESHKFGSSMGLTVITRPVPLYIYQLFGPQGVHIGVLGSGYEQIEVTLLRLGVLTQEKTFY